MSVREAFRTVYAEQEWGKASGGEFNSGHGSQDIFGAPYSKMVLEFAREHSVGTIVDLGCGDFQIGRQISTFGGEYIGIDVVPELVQKLRESHSQDHVSFECRDITSDNLPPGDLALVRQVLQHLSNIEIERVLERCKSYKYVLVTESLPLGRSIVPNVDKPHGPDVRLYRNSGVFVEHPPFSRKTTCLMELTVSRSEIIRTSLVDQEPE